MNVSSIRAGGLPLDEERFAGANVSSPNAAPPGREQRGMAKTRGATLDLAPPAWRGGFKEARRHSARVRVLRRAAAVGSALALALILGAALRNPLTHLPADISVKRVGLDGTKITVDFPKITGVQNNGRPFEIKARSGIQDITAPNITELKDIESSLGGADSSTSWVSAARGVYDSSSDKLTLEGDVRIKSSTGYDIWLRTARVDFKSGGLVSEEPVKVILEGGAIEAKELDVSDNGHKVSFGGDVTSTIENSEEEPPPLRDTAEGGR
jgi:lipopolysaccharide export system protein LptC